MKKALIIVEWISCKKNLIWVDSNGELSYPVLPIGVGFYPKRLLNPFSGHLDSYKFSTWLGQFVLNLPFLLRTFTGLSTYFTTP